MSPKRQDDDLSRQLNQARNEFLPGGAWAPIEDREEYDRKLNSLPPEQKELSQEVTRHADLCRYFSEHDMQVPPHLVRAIREVSSLAVQERAARMRDINQELMEYLQSVSEDSELRM